MAYIYVGLFCCVGPLFLAGLGFLIGRHGLPFRVSISRSRFDDRGGRYG
jgi:hypothetical protein